MPSTSVIPTEEILIEKLNVKSSAPVMPDVCEQSVNSVAINSEAP